MAWPKLKSPAASGIARETWTTSVVRVLSDGDWLSRHPKYTTSFPPVSDCLGVGLVSESLVCPKERSWSETWLANEHRASVTQQTYPPSLAHREFGSCRTSSGVAPSTPFVLRSSAVAVSRRWG